MSRGELYLNRKDVSAVAKVCPRCGTNNTSEARFCGECSAELPPSSLPGGFQPVQWPDLKYTIKRYPASQLIIAVSKTLGVICLVLAGLAALGFFVALVKLTSHDETEKLIALVGVVSTLFQVVFFVLTAVLILYLGETIKVFNDISENTHRTAEAVAELAKRKDP